MNSPKTIGRYEILEELGHGAMGTVYRAKDPSMDRVVALKTIISVALLSSQGNEFRERFYREARAAGRLAHPGIVPVFDVGEHEGLPYLVMEFINGRTLADSLKTGERFALERVCEIGQQIAEALGYAHQHGVIHRDVKPANILLTSLETYKIERPKITDFGVAKLAAGQITLSGQMLGTPAFMPPEQFTGAPVDGRADLFSLGVILYWMATGEQPFPGETMTSVSYKVVHTEPIPPTKLNPSIPARLEAVILKCLLKSPASRYQSGEDLARDLAELRGVNATNLKKNLVKPVPSDQESTSRLALDSQATMPGVPASYPPPVQIAVKSLPKRTIGLIAAAIVLSLGVVFARWFFLVPKQITEPQRITSDGASTQTSPARLAATAAPSQAGSAEVSEHGNKVARTTAIPVSPTQKIKGSESGTPASKTHRNGSVDFDPKALDANMNSRLKIDLPRVPDSLAFTVEMNGKKYLQWSGSSNKAEYQNLFVPPGVQEFRVIAQEGRVRITSSIVSAEFRAKKRRTLKIELRDQPKFTASSSGLSPDSQIFVNLK